LLFQDDKLIALVDKFEVSQFYIRQRIGRKSLLTLLIELMSNVSIDGRRF